MLKNPGKADLDKDKNFKGAQMKRKKEKQLKKPWVLKEVWYNEKGPDKNCKSI